MAPIFGFPSPQVPNLGFSVSHQKVELDIDLPSQSLRGRTEITLSPHSKDLKSVRLNCRQCDLKRLTVNGKACSSASYEDPYKRTTLPWKAGVHQYHMLQQRLENQLKRSPEEELVVAFPKSLKIDDLDPFSEEAQSILLSKSVGSSKGDGSANALDPVQNSRNTAEQAARFTPVQLNIEFVVRKIRDGMQFVGWEDGESRYPHAYSTNSLSPGAACCLFPCVDDLTSRCTCEISLTCQKTVGDAFGAVNSQLQVNGVNGISNDMNGTRSSHRTYSRHSDLSEEDKALELAVICTGDMIDEVSVSAVTFLSTDSSRLTILEIPQRKPPLLSALLLYLYSMSASP